MIIYNLRGVPQYNFALAVQLQSIQKLSLIGPSQTNSVMHSSCSGDVFSAVLQVPIPEAKTKSSVKALASSYLRSVIPCFSVLPPGCKNHSQVPSKFGFSEHPEGSHSVQSKHRGPVQESNDCLPCIWHVGLALCCHRNRSRPPGRKYSGGNKSSSVVFERCLHMFPS